MLSYQKKEFPKKYLFQSILMIMLGCSFSVANAQSQNIQDKNKTTISENLQIYKGSTIDKIKTNREITIGFNSASVPISYTINNTPIGYGIDVCLMIIQNLKSAYNIEELTIKYKEVNNENKFQEIMSGAIDIECGSTSNTAERRRNVDFAIPYYISSTKMLVKKNSGIKDLNNLNGSTISLVNKTTSLDIMNKLNQDRQLNIQPLVVNNFTEGLSAINDNRAQVFVLDDLFLFNELSKLSNSDNFMVLDESLSVEPLSIMLRKDDLEFKRFVNNQLSYYMNSGVMENLYNKWFKSPIPPSKKSLNIPQSYLLKDIFRMPTDIVGN